MCVTHEAKFRIDNGECFGEPCVGYFLEKMPARVIDGMIRVPADAGV